MVLTGRGGFGNYVPSPKTTPKNMPDSPELEALRSVPSTPAPIQHFTSPNQTFRAGRGGYGNKLPISQMHTMTPNEYLQEVQEAMDVEPPRYSVGRGGCGNIVNRNNKKPQQQSSTSFGHSLSTVFSLPSKKSSERKNSDDGLWSRLRTTISN
ncbi:hypothetical protein DV451_004992 [Geotrichum candidum]|uniref:Uncharacterized protein n=1 Tax=Geotrichum candidum TaxID=1173061 RepID=A0A0J9XIH1_GEOCN|nr:hypothetical protein DV451_004992 [Geotrichum candidum]KAI9214454.1 hypothetical protein DS838_000673 [Geotrichum bryndzae]KAF5106634.1 hypothetical protein DV453_003783 [Geotrichum candidum]KAF5113744.1 hypothetical protein DV454_003362 [Geotrichum candidum]KAF5121532.1 hypothetical protein DV495_004296 [Geotrichum candidum]